MLGIHHTNAERTLRMTVMLPPVTWRISSDSFIRSANPRRLMCISSRYILTMISRRRKEGGWRKNARPARPWRPGLEPGHMYRVLGDGQHQHTLCLFWQVNFSVVMVRKGRLRCHPARRVWSVWWVFVSFGWVGVRTVNERMISYTNVHPNFQTRQALVSSRRCNSVT